eukprot:11322782-Alexandrium_andersonii.AAC.1
MSSNTSSKRTVSPTSDVAAGGAWCSLASSGAGRMPANAGSAWPPSSPYPSCACAVLTGAAPLDEEEVPPGR